MPTSALPNAGRREKNFGTNAQPAKKPEQEQSSIASVSTGPESEEVTRSYREVMQERELEREEERVRRKIEEKLKNGDKMEDVEHQATLKADDKGGDSAAEGTRKRVRLYSQLSSFIGY